VADKTGLFDGIGDVVRYTLAGFTESAHNIFFNDYVLAVFNAFMSLVAIAGSPITSLLWMASAGVWFLKAWLFILVVCEAFIMAFAITSQTGFKTFIDYNISFIGGIVRIIHGFVTLIIRLLSAVIPF